MSETNKKPARNLSRREFLRDAGIIVGGTAVGSAFLLTACGEEVEITKTVTTTAPGSTVTTTAPGTTSTITATQTETSYLCPLCEAQFNSLVALKTHFETYHRGEGQIVIKSGYIEWDATKCVACGKCMQACSLYHEGATSYTLSSIKWFENKYFEGWDGELPTYPFFCNQCSSPECYHACPLKDEALCIDEATGARYIVKEKCTGCGICEMACPLVPSRINIDKVLKKAIKCDLCRGRDVRMVAGIKVTNPGSGYTSNPTVTISGGGGTEATAAAQWGSPVASVEVTEGGTGYTSAPNVALSSGGGSGAAATAIITNGSVTAVTVTNGGSLYTAAPTVTISGGGGSGAKATAKLGAAMISAIFVGQQGIGYTAAPTVTISGGGGSGATATAKLSTGQVCIDVCDRGALRLVTAEERIL